MEFSAVNRRRPSRETPLGPGAKKDGCFRRLLDHEILTDHGVFYPQTLYDDLVFELTLSDAAQVVKGSDEADIQADKYPDRIRDDTQQAAG